MKVEWHPLAEKDLIEIVTYIAQDNPQAAFDVFEEIKQQITMLAEHPHLGRPGRVMNTRELVILRTPYLAPYRIMNDVVNILRIVHGARKWPKIFASPKYFGNLIPTSDSISVA